jgi:hypothetical protein
MRGRIVAQLVLAVAAAGCGGATLQEYSSPEGRFRVQFPGKAGLKEEVIPTPTGPIISKIAAMKDWSRIERAVISIDFPGRFLNRALMERKLDSVCQSWADDNNMNISGKSPIQLNGHPGRELVFESRPGHEAGKLTGRARFYMVGTHLYEVIIAGPAGRLTSEKIDGFLDSFALLDQGPGPIGPEVAAGPPPINVAPGGPPPNFPPGPPPNARLQRPRGPNPRMRPGPAPEPARDPEPSPAASLAFYNIPEPASATIEADSPEIGPASADRDHPKTSGLGGLSASKAAAEVASIGTFRWLDDDEDRVGGYGDAARADGTRDQHLRLELDLPPNTTIESMVVTSGGFHRWVTQPSERYWPIGIYQADRPIAGLHVAQVGVFSGPQSFDLYFNTGIGIGPGTAFDLEVTLSIGGRRLTLTSKCRRPEKGEGPLADARPSQPANAPPSPLLMPAGPQAGGPAPEPEPRQEPRPPTDPMPPSRPGSGDRESNEFPTLLTPTSGGATIVSFDWVDRNDDYAGTNGRRIGPDGSKDEHCRLVMDLPPAAIIEEIAIRGGDALRWTTKPSARVWPVAVVSNQEPKNRAQVLRLGAFSGRWTFDLYVESQGAVRPGQPLALDVVVFIGNARHRLTARCLRG